MSPRLLIAAVSLIIIGSAIQAETYMGMVVSAENQTPLSKSTILINGNLNSLAAAEDGTFSIQSSSPHSVVITVSHIGYLTLRHFTLKPRILNTIELEPSASSLDRIVVTANRYAKEAYKVSQPITTVSNNEIEAKGYTVVSDVVRDLPGIDMNDAGPFRARPVIRGLYGTRVLVLLDGERLNDQRDISSFAGVSMSLVDINSVERIEVVNGASSVMYGSDAMGGVINIMTKSRGFSRRFTPDLRYSGRYSTADHQHSNRFDLGFQSDRLSGSAGLLYREAMKDFQPPEGWNIKARYGAFRPQFYDSLDQATGRDFSNNRLVNSRAKINNYDARFAYRLSNHYRLDAEFGFLRGNDIGYPGVPNDSTPFWFFYPKHDRDNFTLTLTGRDLSDELANLSTKFYYERFTKDFLTDFLGSIVVWFGPPGAAPSITPLTSLNYTLVTKYGLNFQELYSLRKNSQLTFGFDLLREEIDGNVKSITQYAGFGPTPFDSITTGSSVPRNDWNSVGVYLSAETNLDPVTVTAGTRYDNFWINTRKTAGYVDDSDRTLPTENEHYGAVNGSLGLTFALTRHVSIVGNVGTAYRVPNVVERFYFGSASNRLTRPNPNIKPERAVSNDLGVKAIHDKINYSLIGFYSNYSNFTQLEKFDSIPGHGGSFTPLWRYENIEDVTIYGFEGVIEGNFDNGLYGSVSLSYQHGQDKTFDQPIFVSPIKAMMTFGYRYKRRGAFGEFTLKKVGDQNRVPDVAYLDDIPTEGYTLVNATAGVRIWKNIKFSASVNNVFNEIYSEPFNARNPDNLIAEPGRNLILTVNASL